MYFGLPMGERVIRTNLLYAAIGGYPPAIILGVPIFLCLMGRVRASALNCAAAGAVVAGIPWLILILGLGANTIESSTGDYVTVEHGVRTFWGWIELFEVSGAIASAGALAGVVFWIIAAAGGRTDAQGA
ncbi:hypothetical protein DYH55_06335 [Methylovirgula sp. 4M-Z18]|nr:hypothetical protein DYH55_06335 [Methylovirgula sp. 4M-Z18]